MPMTLLRLSSDSSQWNHLRWVSMWWSLAGKGPDGDTSWAYRVSSHNPTILSKSNRTSSSLPQFPSSSQIGRKHRLTSRPSSRQIQVFFPLFQPTNSRFNPSKECFLNTEAKARSSLCHSRLWSMERRRRESWLLRPMTCTGRIFWRDACPSTFRPRLKWRGPGSIQHLSESEIGWRSSGRLMVYFYFIHSCCVSELRKWFIDDDI